VVFNVLQNLVGIGGVVLKICEFVSMRVWLENAHSRHLWGENFE